MKSKFKLYISIAIVALLSIFLVVQKIISNKDKVKPNQKSTVNTILNVNAKKINYKTVNDKIITSGTFLADENIVIQSEVPGKIQKINFEEGKRVSAKQLLIKLKSDDIEAQIKKGKENLSLLELTEKRQKKLLATNGVSQEDYDIAHNAVEAQKADLDYLKAQLDKTEIYSPFSGIAGLRYFSVGSYVSTTDIISNIFKVDRLKLEFSIPQKYYNLLNIGQEVEFHLPPNPNGMKAKIYAVDPEINTNTRTLVVRAYYNNSNGSIKPGSFAQITININSDSKKLMIPTQALIPDLESEKVYVYKDGKAIVKKVQTGLRTTSEIEIVDGLSEGDIVITSGIIQLRPNALVKITMSEEK